MPVEDDLARLGGVGSVDGPEQFGATRPDEAGEADDLALVQVEGDVADPRLPGEVADGEHNPVAGGGRAALRSGDGPADHEANELLRPRGGRDPAGHGPAVLQDRDAVADPSDLVEAVGDVDHADALVREAAHHIEEHLDLLPAQDRRWFVHDQQADVAGQRPGDGDDLLVGGAEVLDGRGRVETAGAEPGEEGGGLVVHAAAVEQEGVMGFVAEEDVLRRAEAGDEVELLVDGGDAPGEGALGFPAGNGSPSKRTSPEVGWTRPEMHLMSVVFPAPFWPTRQWTSPGDDVEVDAVESEPPEELLGEGPHGEQGSGHGATCVAITSRWNTRDFVRATA